MYLCYVDEAGDDGYPRTSSDLFALTLLYMHHDTWRTNLDRVHNCRAALKKRYGMPVKLEFHAKAFLTDKNPYRAFGFSVTDRRNILAAYFRLIAELDISIINVAIDKTRIVDPNYNVMDRALTYGIQRIENDLRKNHKGAAFMMISDEGRLAKMVSTARRMRRHNYIASLFGGSYRQDIQSLIEDPLAKSSNESWYIQLADLVVTIAYYHKLLERGLGHLPKRMEAIIKPHELEKLLRMVEHRLNVNASRSCRFGIATFPK